MKYIHGIEGRIMIEDVTNKNLKKMLSKKRLNPEMLMEFKTSYFIIATIELDNDYFRYVYENEDTVMYLFTSMDEYRKVYGEEEYKPDFFSLDELEDIIYRDFEGVYIDPSSDNFFLSKNLLYHIILDIKQNNKEMRFQAFRRETWYDNTLLIKYCSGKKSLRQIPNLFQYLDACELYTVIEIHDDVPDESKIPLRGIKYNYFKPDSYYHLFTDTDLLKDYVSDFEGNFYYGISDVIDIVQLIFQYDFEGIILTIPDNEFVLKRDKLLKHFEKSIKYYRPRQDAREFAYKIE